MPNQEHGRERERERDQTHSYWYIPSAPRVNYSLLVMDSAGMMKMATEDPPSEWVPGRAPERYWWLQRLVTAKLPVYLDFR